MLKYLRIYKRILSQVAFELFKNLYIILLPCVGLTIAASLLILGISESQAELSMTKTYASRNQLFIVSQGLSNRNYAKFAKSVIADQELNAAYFYAKVINLYFTTNPNERRASYLEIQMTPQSAKILQLPITDEATYATQYFKDLYQLKEPLKLLVAPKSFRAIDLIDWQHELLLITNHPQTNAEKTDLCCLAFTIPNDLLKRQALITKLTKLAQAANYDLDLTTDEQAFYGALQTIYAIYHRLLWFAIPLGLVQLLTYAVCLLLITRKERLELAKAYLAGKQMWMQKCELISTTTLPLLICYLLALFMAFYLKTYIPKTFMVVKLTPLACCTTAICYAIAAILISFWRIRVCRLERVLPCLAQQIPT